MKERLENILIFMITYFPGIIVCSAAIIVIIRLIKGTL